MPIGLIRRFIGWLGKEFIRKIGQVVRRCILRPENDGSLAGSQVRLHAADGAELIRPTGYASGKISFAEFDASEQGWINHVRYADTWGLRRHLLGKPLKQPLR